MGISGTPVICDGHPHTCTRALEVSVTKMRFFAPHRDGGRIAELAVQHSLLTEVEDLVALRGPDGDVVGERVDLEEAPGCLRVVTGHRARSGRCLGQIRA